MERPLVLNEASMNITEATMRTRNNSAELAGAIPAIDELDAPVDAWTLDELDRFGELHSLLAAGTGADDPGT
jgi:hypothetical protein